MQIAVGVEEDFDGAEALLVTSWERKESWALNCGCSFHMCPMKKELFETIKLEQGGIVHFENSEACKI